MSKKQLLDEMRYMFERKQRYAHLSNVQRALAYDVAEKAYELDEHRLNVFAVFELMRDYERDMRVLWKSGALEMIFNAVLRNDTHE